MTSEDNVCDFGCCLPERKERLELVEENFAHLNILETLKTVTGQEI